tara:strand:- start:212 stop:409 length:198 start_codon:yes stop_codon:yes gene_type:complete
MTHNIKEKISQLEKQLEESVNQYNELVKQRQTLFNQITALQGALQALKEVDHDHTDLQSSESDDT